MLPKLKILMLLATIVPEILSAPPTNSSLPLKNALPMAANGPLDNLIEFKRMVQNAYVALDVDMTEEKFKRILLAALSQDMFAQLDLPISQFNKKLMKEMLKDPNNAGRNILYSSLTINIALAMLYYASPERTRTHTQIAEALSLDDDLIVDYLGDYHNMLKFYETQKTGLELASKIFVAGDVPIELDFVEVLKDFFRTSADNLDTEPGKAVAQINNFVKEKTKGNIKKILSPSDKKIKMVVVNALYYKDAWVYPFNRKCTEPMDFTLFDGTTVHPPGMWQVNEKLRMGKSLLLDSWLLELPYENGFSMIIVVPIKNGPEALKEAATRFNYESAVENLEKQDYGVEVLMPRIEIEYNVDLVQYLELLEVTEIFSPIYGGDFRRMTSQGGIRVDSFIHKTKMVVNEEGAEAAASNCIVKCERSCAVPTKFLVNKPYAFFLIDVAHKVPVLSATVTDPTGQDSPGAPSL